jgi:hypothetical protein
MSPPRASLASITQERHGNSRDVVITSPFADKDVNHRIGTEAYSYYYVRRAFMPLLQRWGTVTEVSQTESQVDHVLDQLRTERRNALHLSFLPLQAIHLNAHAPNVAFPFWEFPDIPDISIADNSRNNWVQVARKLALILTACTFTRDAFLRAGVKAPIKVVPVPVRPEYFAVPMWRPDDKVTIQCPCYILSQQSEPSASTLPQSIQATRRHVRPGDIARRIYREHVKPRLPFRLKQYLSMIASVARASREAREHERSVSWPLSPALSLTGIVYTTLFNPFDPRKHWQDLLSAYLLSLGNQEEATLVIKLVVKPTLAALAVNGILTYYRELAIPHRCKLIVTTSYLSDAQLLELTRASTYYVNPSRAEGACLPLQDHLAAGRPGISPLHTAMADYFQEDVGWTVVSHPEPTHWPHDPSRRCATTWHRLVWQSLHDHFRESFRVATREINHYRTLAGRSRERMIEFASADQVWPRLKAALDAVPDNGSFYPLRIPSPVLRNAA